MGETAPDVLLGEPAAEYPRGDTLVEMIFGVAVGVRRGEMYGVMENLFPVYFEATK